MNFVYVDHKSNFP